MQLKNPPQVGAGIAFKVKEKKHEKAPDWDAILVLDEDCKAGQQIKIAMWNRQGASGMFLSMKIDNFKPKAKPDAETFKPKEIEAFDDDIPF